MVFPMLMPYGPKVTMDIYLIITFEEKLEISSKGFMAASYQNNNNKKKTSQAVLGLNQKVLSKGTRKTKFCIRSQETQLCA